MDRIDKFLDDLEETFAYIREREGGDSVCGLCEYDGAYIGESGDWCNECPGFNKDDCFKLSAEIRKKWTDKILAICRNVGGSSEIPNSSDCISRQAAIDALMERFKRVPTTAIIAKDIIENLPSAQPEPLSAAYTKAVWTWLIDYQIKAAELKGRYTPYEVLSWVANDWRKEHE